MNLYRKGKILWRLTLPIFDPAFCRKTVKACVYFYWIKSLAYIPLKSIWLAFIPSVCVTRGSYSYFEGRQVCFSSLNYLKTSLNIDTVSTSQASDNLYMHNDRYAHALIRRQQILFLHSRQNHNVLDSPFDIGPLMGAIIHIQTNHEYHWMYGD